MVWPFWHGPQVTRIATRAGRAVPALGLVTALAGCLEAPGGAFGFLTDKTGATGATKVGATGQTAPARARAAPVRQVELVRGKVAIVAPRGYCIDAESRRQGLAGGFVLIAACNSLTGDYSGADAEPVLMTAQAQPGFLTRELPDAATLAAAAGAGRMLHKVDGDGLTLVHLDAGGDRGLPSGDPRHWRGALLINGYLVGLALYAPKGSAMAGPRGRDLIQQLAENMLDASPIPDFSEAAKAVRPKKN